jgi:DNA repair photolyase
MEPGVMSTFKPTNRPPTKGRGALSNREGRFARQVIVRSSELSADDIASADASDFDPADAEHPVSIATEVRGEQARSIITRNSSADIPFNLSMNPYRGCEHGCIYCFARPTHSYLDLSPGLDFETRLVAKQNAAACLKADLGKRSYQCEPIALGTATDPYQPIEAQYRITRQLLEVALQYRQPLSIITKSRLILDDIALLAQMAQHNLVNVMVSVTTLDRDLKRVMEPRAASGEARLDTIAALRQVGVPVGMLVAPIIPALNDYEIEPIVEAGAAAGALSAAYVLLRLPLELKDLFQQWLHSHFPDRANHVLSVLSQMRGGQLYDARTGSRMRGEGPFADLIRQRFTKACKRYGIVPGGMPALDCSSFAVPCEKSEAQLSLW